MSRAIAVAVTGGQVLMTWRNWIGLCLLASGAAAIAGLSNLSAAAVVGAALPLVVLLAWSQAAPASFEQRYAGPTRRRLWRRRVRERWAELMQECGLASRGIPRRTRDAGPYFDVPRLRRVRTSGDVLELTVETRRGQTVEELHNGIPKLASSMRASTFRVRPAEGRRAGFSSVVELVMRDSLTGATRADGAPRHVMYDEVTLGRSQSGGHWQLAVRGRHTLVAGCSGAGKGSVLWGLCCGLAPAVARDVVRLWGVDLKRGVELEMGASLFSARAYTPRDAVEVLKALLAVVDERGHAMAGSSRLHEPTEGDPLHVLVIDELAALTAYSDVTIRREAERLLSELLTQGRALGVVVVACVQDPRKDVVPMRGLFTQTVALRLRSVEETIMVLGEGPAAIAPAHRISPVSPGTAWIVDDTGAVDRVQADYWPDDIIRMTAETYPTPVHFDPPPAPERDRPDFDFERMEVRRPRTPRKPRTTAPQLGVVTPLGGDQG